MDFAEAFRALSAYGPAGALLVVVFVSAWERREDRTARAAELDKRLRVDELRASADVELARTLAGLTGAVTQLQANLPQVCRAGFSVANAAGLRPVGHG